MASRDTTVENREYFKNELSSAIREIRSEYDHVRKVIKRGKKQRLELQVSNTTRTDIESWYKLKVQEIHTQNSRNCLEQNYAREEVKRLRTTLGDMRGKMADLEGRVRFDDYIHLILFVNISESSPRKTNRRPQLPDGRGYEII